MNRIQLLDARRTHLSSRRRKHDEFSIFTHAVPPHHGFFIPIHYEPNYAYPLVVWLHGPQSSESEVGQVMPYISERNYVGVAPRGVIRERSIGAGRKYSWNQSRKSVVRSTEDVLQCIDIARQRFHIAPRRIFLAGVDEGGALALRIALAHPHLFAGAASIGGAWPHGCTPLCDLKEARKLPILLSYGSDSHLYGANEVCRDLRLMHTAALQVTLRQYPCPHEVTTQMLSDLNVWMMERVTGVSTSPTQDSVRIAAQDN